MGIGNLRNFIRRYRYFLLSYMIIEQENNNNSRTHCIIEISPRSLAEHWYFLRNIMYTFIQKSCIFIEGRRARVV